MSVSNLFKPGGLAWQPDSNSINAPEGALLRADNMVPDETGALTVRRGTDVLYTFPLGTEDLHSLHTVELRDGYTYRLMGADSTLYRSPGPGNHTAHWEVRIAEAASFTAYGQRNYTGGAWEKDYAQTNDVGPMPFTAWWEGPTGNDYIASLVTTLEPVNFNVTFTGTGDLAMGNDASQVFMARGTTSKKFDGKSLLEWGIAKPTTKPTVTAVTPTSLALAPFDQADNPNYTTSNTAPFSFVPDAAGTAASAVEVTPITINRGRTTYFNIYRQFATDQDFQDIDGTGGSDNDIFDLTIKMEDPDHVQRIELAFDLDTTPSTQAYTDRYYFVFYPKEGQKVVVRDPEEESSSVYDANVSSSLDPVDPKDKPRENTPREVKNTIEEVGADRAKEAEGTAGGGTPPPDTWIHLSLTRSQFKRIGSTAGRDWSTVTQIAIGCHKDKGYLGKVTLDNLVVYSAGEGTLTGKYQALYRYVRETDYYYELSPPSPISDPIYLYANQLKVTVPGAAQNAADDQVTDVWVYLYGGYLDTYYRAATATLDPQLSTDCAVSIAKNEIEILTENEVLEPYLDTPRDNIIAVAGPWNGRMFTLTDEGFVYPSLQNCPSAFNTYQVIDLSGLGDPFWLVKTASGIHAGMEKDVVFMAGSGDEDADRVVIDLYPHPLNIGTPPVDKGHYVEGNSIIYRTKDGLVTLASQGLTHIPDGGTSLLWRGQDRHGVSALNISTGRFRLTVDNAILFMLAPEGATTEGTTVVYRLDLKKGQWSRLIYPNSLLSILTEPDGTLVAGTNNGRLLLLESGTGDTLVNPSVTILTPFMDGGNPLVRKDAFDLQFHADTNANTATVTVYKDGSASSSASYTFSTSQPQPYRIQADDIGSFVRAQMSVTGTFDEFILSAMNLSYRVRPQHMTYLDTGYFVADDPADVVWVQEVELDVNSPSSLEVLLYLDDRLYTTQTVTVTANVRKVYRVPMPRGAKSYRPRIVVRTTAADGAGEVGFDPYFVRVRTRGTGNQSQGRFKTVWPVGTAP